MNPHFGKSGNHILKLNRIKNYKNILMQKMHCQISNQTPNCQFHSRIKISGLHPMAVCSSGNQLGVGNETHE